MSTRTVDRRAVPEAAASQHWLWLVGGFLFAFTVPFVLADLVGIDRDLFYGLYAAGVIGFVLACRDPRLPA